MYFYSAYGLNICSDIPLPELCDDTRRLPDTVIRLGTIDRSLPALDGLTNGSHVVPGNAYLFWETVVAIHIRHGKEIVIEPAPDVEWPLLRILLLGTVMALLLHQRGHLVLHASAVVIDDKAVAFVGQKGQGKSTIAAALYARGHTLLADDVVAIDTRHPDRPMVLPSFPQFKLMPESAAIALGDDPESLPKLASCVDKRARRADDRFAAHPFPLGAIYALTSGEEPAVTQLTPQQAMVQLLTHSFASRFGTSLLSGAEAAGHLRHCANVAGHASINQFEYPRSLPLLATVAQLVEECCFQASREAILA